MKYRKTCDILGVHTAVTDMGKTVSFLEEHLSELRGQYICVANVHTTVMAKENKKYREIQNNAAMVLPDGKPLSVMERRYGHADAEKVSGPDLMPELFRLSEKKEYTHYFYGSTKQTLNELEKKIKQQYPGLKIAGMYAPPFRELTKEEDAQIIEKINAAAPDFLWVGLGAPKQEIWMAGHENKFPSVMIGVGAGFDFLAGTVKRAPLWMQRSGLEWLHRLFQDPGRLWKRYVVTNTKFIWYMIKQRKEIHGRQ